MNDIEIVKQHTYFVIHYHLRLPISIVNARIHSELSRDTFVDLQEQFLKIAFKYKVRRYLYITIN